ncbi:MAG: hypothetical protein K6G80_00630 [Treponema sp.]|nr:hypothetical protein [Treponema sp.]
MKVLAYGFNRRELALRRRVFQRVTGERLFELADSVDSCLEQDSPLVIVNAQEPFAVAGHAAARLASNGSNVLLYGERTGSSLLYHSFKYNERISFGICMDEAEYASCCSALKSGRRYNSIASERVLKR